MAVEIDITNHSEPFFKSSILNDISLIEPNFNIKPIIINGAEYVKAKDVENLVDPAIFRNLSSNYVQYCFDLQKTVIPKK